MFSCDEMVRYKGQHSNDIRAMCRFRTRMNSGTSHQLDYMSICIVRIPQSHQEGRGRCDARPQQGDVALKVYVAMYVSSISDVSEVCCKSFIWMLLKYIRILYML
jgi:hypothetical protein